MVFSNSNFLYIWLLIAGIVDILRQSDIHPQFRIYTIHIFCYFAKFFYDVHFLWINYVMMI